jgi:hypothetical protein
MQYINGKENAQANIDQPIKTQHKKPISTYDQTLITQPVKTENINPVTASMAYEIVFGPEKHEVNGMVIDSNKIIPKIQTIPEHNISLCAPIIHEPIIIPNNTNNTINESIGNTAVVSSFKGLPDCEQCRGKAFKVNKRGKLKPCRNCLKQTGNCGICNNTGYKMHNGKKCKCNKLKKHRNAIK